MSCFTSSTSGPCPCDAPPPEPGVALLPEPKVRLPRQLVDLLRAHAELQQDLARVLTGSRPCMMKPFRVRACGQVDRGADQIDIPERRVRRRASHPEVSHLVVLEGLADVINRTAGHADRCEPGHQFVD